MYFPFSGVPWWDERMKSLGVGGGSVLPRLGCPLMEGLVTDYKKEFCFFTDRV